MISCRLASLKYAWWRCFRGNLLRFRKLTDKSLKSGTSDLFDQVQRQHECSSKVNRQLVKSNLPSSSSGTELRISPTNTFTRNEIYQSSISTSYSTRGLRQPERGIQPKQLQYNASHSSSSRQIDPRISSSSTFIRHQSPPTMLSQEIHRNLVSIPIIKP
ncbi:unnamed protein product [Protopolystoma xenopodis]|uniref:Uncharacterized protein n=1 Tax=Protopolystoma xenopodis TaxID=117903 RepID=A0A3S5A9F9_9PLAT|nr:unnamed protein product [Protopolystoma xenopodis]